MWAGDYEQIINHDWPQLISVNLGADFCSPKSGYQSQKQPVFSPAHCPLIVVILQPIPMILQIPLIITLSLQFKLQKNKYSHEHFSDYLPNETSSTIFIQPTDKEEIAKIISSLNSNKDSDPNSISYRIFLLRK